MPRRIGQGWPALLASMALNISRAALTAFAASSGVIDRRAENGEEAVTEELVHDAIVPVDNVDQDFENGVEPRDHFGGRALARRRGEAANINKHDADPPHFAELGRTDCKQTLDHLR